MSNYPKMTITYAGHDMIAESQADKKPLIFTKVVLGDGQLSPGQRIEELTAPIATRMDVPLSSGQKQSNGQVKLRFSISNSALEEGFFVREVTVYAKVGDDGQERLYACRLYAG
ncbi:phage tail-collar fiber domain-containing protein [Selenomonas sp. F0473]|uniref:phage tail-collar fiber domain-containing protein n=1 Tax=Selenomonas sp. F0473 TaxID=999423 RepID=UPI0025D49366|nr:phage tail protein [Selenomonas sp. F0473]